MEKGLYTITENREVTNSIYMLTLQSEEKTKCIDGEFVNVTIPGKYLKRPISIMESAPGYVKLLYKVMGEGTSLLSKMNIGENVELLTGLGKGFDASKTQKKALLIGGGMGVAALLSIAKRLSKDKKQCCAILGFGSKKDVILEKEFRDAGAQVIITTIDGTHGMKGLVTNAISTQQPEYDFFYACGPMPMMKAVHDILSTSGEYSLEERMGCGAGFCYGCSIETNHGPKRVCKDGPVFEKEDMLW
ncbi:MAG: dihydroorotate dehydrogenase electron transfer subunit [Alistipes sp.]|nr:dihydroorotate dehydrogenase electron transfer subunit [Candidatus Alistipes equi]